MSKEENAPKPPAKTNDVQPKETGKAEPEPAEKKDENPKNAEQETSLVVRITLNNHTRLNEFS